MVASAGNAVLAGLLVVVSLLGLDTGSLGLALVAGAAAGAALHLVLRPVLLRWASKPISPPSNAIIESSSRTVTRASAVAVAGLLVLSGIVGIGLFDGHFVVAVLVANASWLVLDSHAFRAVELELDLCLLRDANLGSSWRAGPAYYETEELRHINHDLQGPRHGSVQMRSGGNNPAAIGFLGLIASGVVGGVLFVLDFEPSDQTLASGGFALVVFIMLIVWGIQDKLR